MESIKYLNADFLDILFEDKNKEYGAYALRKGYAHRVAKALVITFLFCFIAVGAIMISDYFRLHDPVEKTLIRSDLVLQQVDVKQRDLPSPPPPPPPPAPEPPKVQTQVKYTPPKVVKDELVKPEEEPPDLSRLKNVAIGMVNEQGIREGMYPDLVDRSGSGVTQAVPASSEKIRVFVEQMPSFPGGAHALMKYLRDHIHYPAVARNNEIQGIVVIQFVVNTDGSIVDVKAVGRKKGGGLEEEAVRVVESMPHWNPGMQNGRKVRVQYSLPVRFKLQ